MGQKRMFLLRAYCIRAGKSDTYIFALTYLPELISKRLGLGRLSAFVLSYRLGLKH